MAQALGKHFDALVDRFIRTGRYQSKTEVVRAGLRLLEDQEFEPPELEAAMLEALKSCSRPLEKDWAERVRRAGRRLRKRQRQRDAA
ncbi:MAG TPA: type II toxin-antitoxin system ParD family antitoxin [Verrucomicrobiae bacterium]|nr:type II toxin-antitoxin system ParD family antitoxin [Verrucomicrobiae bacterium]